MAWVKIPKENHDVFRDAMPPGDRRVTVIAMFGGLAAKVNGYMASGLFARSFVVKLGDAEREKALALDGATMFDPMGNGRVMADTVMMPEAIMDDRDELRAWVKKAIDYCAGLPAKTEKKKGRTATTEKKAKAEAKAKAKAEGEKKKKAKPARR
jgi:TfoX/Sxy family transcriptional regulator of competence genes